MKDSTLVTIYVDELPQLRAAADRSPLAQHAHGLLVALEDRAQNTSGGGESIRPPLLSTDVETLWAIAPPDSQLPAHSPGLRDRLTAAWSRLNPQRRKRGRPRKARA